MKIIAFILLVMMMFSLTVCGSNSSDRETNGKSNPTTFLEIELSNDKTEDAICSTMIYSVGGDLQEGIYAIKCTEMLWYLQATVNMKTFKKQKSILATSIKELLDNGTSEINKHDTKASNIFCSGVCVRTY